MKRYTYNEIDKLADILKNDGVICVPTDTVYGLCARINSKKAYDNLVNIKNRPNIKLFPVVCLDEEQIKNIAIVNKYAEKLIHAFMPGPITLVFKKKDNISHDSHIVGAICGFIFGYLHVAGNLNSYVDFLYIIPYT